LLNEKNIKNIIIYTAPNFVGYALSLIAMPIMTRLLRPADYGIIIMANLFPAIAVGLLTFGLVSATQRNYFQYRRDKEQLNGLIVSSQIFLYLMLIASSLVVFFFKDNISRLIIGRAGYGDAILAAYLGVYLAYIITFYSTILQGMEKAKLFAVIMIVQNTLIVLLNLFYVGILRLSYMGPLLGTLTVNFCLTIVIALAFNSGFSFRINLRLLWENMLFGLQLVPKVLTGFVNRFFDKYLLNNMLSLSAVGVYNLGQNIGVIMFNLMSAVWNSFQPVFYREVFDKGEVAAKPVGRLFTVFLYLTMIPVMSAVVFAREIIMVMAPPAYYAAIPVIIIIACAYASNVFGIFVGLQYAYTKKAYLIFPITIFGTLANVAANIVLIPRLGLIGGALSFLISYLVLNIALAVIGQRLYRVAYEWGHIIPLYALVYSAAAAILYLQKIDYPFLLLFPIKLALLAVFLFIGYQAGIVRRHRIEMLLKMFKRGGKVAEPTIEPV
jgi:O-antigen/teichoic acid export membrane protein